MIEEAKKLGHELSAETHVSHSKVPRPVFDPVPEGADTPEGVRDAGAS